MRFIYEEREREWNEILYHLLYYIFHVSQGKCKIEMLYHKNLIGVNIHCMYLHKILMGYK